MSKILLIFIHGNNIGTYINVLTHCILNENIGDIFFVGNQVLKDEKSDLIDFIEEIRKEVKKLLQDYDIYREVEKRFPSELQISQEERILRVPFFSPEKLIPTIQSRFPKLDDVIIDISGCNKRLASDIVTSYMTSKLVHVCHFELDKKVYKDEWRVENRSKMYHDLKLKSYSYYEYDDLSAPGTTFESIKKSRSQGYWMRFLVFVSIVLAASVAYLVVSQQDLAATISAIFLAVILSVSFFVDLSEVQNKLRRS